MEHQILFMVYQEDRIFLWNTKKLSCNNKKLIWNAKKVHSPEYHEAFMEYQETFFYEILKKLLWNAKKLCHKEAIVDIKKLLIGIPRNS